MSISVLFSCPISDWKKTVQNRESRAREFTDSAFCEALLTCWISSEGKWHLECIVTTIASLVSRKLQFVLEGIVRESTHPSRSNGLVPRSRIRWVGTGDGE